MTKESSMRLHSIYNILFSIVLVIAGICLIIGDLTIYYSGDQPFSRASVATTFSTLSFPINLALVMTVVSFIWEFFSPSKKETKPKANSFNYPALLKAQYDRRDFANAELSVKDEIISLWKKRNMHIIIRTIVLISCSAIFLFYALNSANFHQSEINASMINAMKVLVPCSLVSFGYALFVSYYNEKSFKKELKLIQKLPLLSEEDIPKILLLKEIILILSRFGILILSITLVIHGALNGGIIDVLAKAINICTECIGLG